MIIRCPDCTTGFKLPNDQVSEDPIKVRCSKCSHIFKVGLVGDEPILFDEDGERLPEDAQQTRVETEADQNADAGQTQEGTGFTTESTADDSDPGVGVDEADIAVDESEDVDTSDTHIGTAAIDADGGDGESDDSADASSSTESAESSPDYNPFPHANSDIGPKKSKAITGDDEDQRQDAEAAAAEQPVPEEKVKAERAKADDEAFRETQQIDPEKKSGDKAQQGQTQQAQQAQQGQQAEQVQQAAQQPSQNQQSHQGASGAQAASQQPQDPSPQGEPAGQQQQQAAPQQQSGPQTNQQPDQTEQAESETLGGSQEQDYWDKQPANDEYHDEYFDPETGTTQKKKDESAAVTSSPGAAPGTEGGVPNGGKPAAGQPAGGQPDGGRPTAGQPSGGQPAGGQPSGGQPAGGQPGQPRAGGGGQAAGRQPANGHTAGGQAAGGQAAGGQAAGGRTAGGRTGGGQHQSASPGGAADGGSPQVQSSPSGPNGAQTDSPAKPQTSDADSAGAEPAARQSSSWAVDDVERVDDQFGTSGFQKFANFVLIVYIVGAGFLTFVASQNAWFVDFKNFRQMLQVAFQDGEYEPREEWTDTEPEVQTAPPKDPVEFRHVFAQVVTLGGEDAGDDAPRVLVLRGDVKNISGQAFSAAKIRGLVKDPQGKVIEQQVAPLGAKLAPTQLRSLESTDAIDEELPDAPAELGDGDTQPFTIVFPSVPEDVTRGEAVKYAVEFEPEQDYDPSTSDN